MLLDIKCDQIPSVYVELLFDDNSTKKKVISVNDLIDVYYNGNGLRKHIVGRVAAISTVGADPRQWYIIVDGSDDFNSQKARFSPKNILDLNIIRKYWQDSIVHTSNEKDERISHIRLTSDGQLQYSTDGYEWNFFKINADDIINLKDLIKSEVDKVVAELKKDSNTEVINENKDQTTNPAETKSDDETKNTEKN